MGYTQVKERTSVARRLRDAVHPGLTRRGAGTGRYRRRASHALNEFRSGDSVAMLAPSITPSIAALEPGWLQLCYICSMTEVASRELRNNTAGLLRRVQSGEDITVTVNGKAVARLSALQPARRRWLSRDELMGRLDRTQADPALRQELGELVGDTTDDLDPLP
jgi:prevent-host-death family protein